MKGRMRLNREKRRVEVTRKRTTVMRNPVKGPQGFPEITALLFPPRIGPSTSFYP